MSLHKIFLPILASSLLLGASGARAQSPTDVYRNSMQEIHGTARAQAMSNAVGALGADPTAVSVNPAGIGLYRSSEVTFGFNVGHVKSSTNWQDKEGADMSKWVSNLDHLSIIFPISNPYLATSDWRVVLGASMSSLYDYDRDYEMRSVNPEYSLSEYIANKATLFGAHYNTLANLSSSPYFLGTMAYNGGFIEWRPNHEDIYVPATFALNNPLISNDKDIKYAESNRLYLKPDAGRLNVSEKGSRKMYDFTIGGSWADKVYFGATLRTTSSAYARSSMYREDFHYTYKPKYNVEDQVYYTELGNSMTVSGGTVGASFGLMAAVGDLGRIGISYNTPQFGRYNEIFYTTTQWYNNNRTNSKDELEPLYTNGTDDMTNTYNLVLPGDLTASAMVFLGGYGMVTYDFNWRDLGSARLQGGDFQDANQFLKEDYGSQMTHRVGLEIRPVSGFYLRAGYSYSDGGLKSDGLRPQEGNVMAYDYVASGAITDAVLRDSYQSISAGVGCRLFGRTTLDLAYVRGKATERVFPFPGTGEVKDQSGQVVAPGISSEGAAMSTVTNRMVASLTFRF